jgi:hypothetical protein
MRNWFAFAAQLLDNPNSIEDNHLMSKKHFNSIAATIAEEIRGHQYMVNEMRNATSERYVLDREQHAYAINVLHVTAGHLADQFEAFNANFDRQRFLVAAGVR